MYVCVCVLFLSIKWHFDHIKTLLDKISIPWFCLQSYWSWHIASFFSCIVSTLQQWTWSNLSQPPQKKGVFSRGASSQSFYCKCLSHIQLCNMQLPNKSERIWINLTFSFFIVIFPYSKNFRSIEICRFWRCQKLHTCHMDPISRNLKWR